MADDDTAYNEFEALWQKAINQQEDLQVGEIEDFHTDIQLIPLLQRLSRLADKLASTDSINSSQYDQMQTAIVNLKEVIETIDPAVLSEALDSIN